MQNKYILLFPGQGSQSQAMLSDLYGQYSYIQDLFSRASLVLGYDLWDIIVQKPELLAKTEYTQPAMLVCNYAIWLYLRQEQGLGLSSVAAMIGHSLGEYSALLAADAIDFEDCCRLVDARAKAMASIDGSMVAILGLNLEQVVALCAGLKGFGYAAPANINGSQQIVVACDSNITHDLMIAAKNMGAKRCVRLPVSVPSHCQLMQPIVDDFNTVANAIKWEKPILPVLHNATNTYTDDAKAIPNLLIKQLTQQINWPKIIDNSLKLDNIYNRNNIIFLECGPGKVLTNLTSRVLKSYDTLFEVQSYMQIDKIILTS